MITLLFFYFFESRQKRCVFIKKRTVGQGEVRPSAHSLSCGSVGARIASPEALTSALSIRAMMVATSASALSLIGRVLSSIKSEGMFCDAGSASVCLRTPLAEVFFFGERKREKRSGKMPRFSGCSFASGSSKKRETMPVIKPTDRRLAARLFSSCSRRYLVQIRIHDHIFPLNI